MSKLAALVAIPLGLLALKRLQKEFPDDPTPKPIGFTLGPAGTDMDIAPLFPTGKLQLTTTIPGGAAVATGPTKPLGTGVTATPVPFFPDTAPGAAAEFAAKKPFEFGVFPTFDLSGIAGIGEGTFTSGFFDPDFQAGLRKK